MTYISDWHTNVLTADEDLIDLKLLQVTHTKITYQGVKKICQQQGAEHSGKGDSCEAGHSCEGVKCEVKNKQKNMMAYDYN